MRVAPTEPGARIATLDALRRLAIPAAFGILHGLLLYPAGGLPRRRNYRSSASMLARPRRARAILRFPAPKNSR